MAVPVSSRSHGSRLRPHAAAQSAGADIEGKYELLQPPQLTETGDRIEVVDIFWYGCPHCYTFLPMMEAYDITKPEYVEVRRLPAIFRESWVAHARAYYTAMLLGVTNTTHRPLFEEIHEHRKPTDSKEALAAFFERHGVDRTTFGADLRLVRGRIAGPQVHPDAAALRHHRHAVGRRQREVPGHRPTRGELQRRDGGGDGARRPGAQGAAGRIELTRRSSGSGGAR